MAYLKVDRLAKPRMYEALLWTSPMRPEWLSVKENADMACNGAFTFHGARRGSVALLNPKTFASRHSLLTPSPRLLPHSVGQRNKTRPQQEPLETAPRRSQPSGKPRTSLRPNPEYR